MLRQKNKALLTACLLTALLIPSCQKPDSGGMQGYLVFGEYYGMCQGPECIRYFKIQDEQLFENTVDLYPSAESTINLNYAEYNGTYPQELLGLAAMLPGGIYDEAPLIGMPDAYDQGGYYLELNSGNTTRYWKIDKDRGTIPVYLHSYCDTLDYFLEIL